MDIESRINRLHLTDFTWVQKAKACNLSQNWQTGYKSERSTMSMLLICETSCSSFSVIMQQISAIEPPRRKRCSTGSSSVMTLVRGSLIGWEGDRKWRIWPGDIPVFKQRGAAVFVREPVYEKHVVMHSHRLRLSPSSSISWGLESHSFINRTELDQ